VQDFCLLSIAIPRAARFSGPLGLAASLANAEGDVHFYQGDLKAAKDSYLQAQRLASHSADKDVLLTSKLNLARLEVGEGRSPAALVGDLRALAQQADALGRKYISVVPTTLMAQALIENKDYTHAKQELQRNLSKAEKLGLRLQNARVHFLLGRALRLGGTTSESTPQYREALRLLEEIRKEPGAEHIIERCDLKPICAETTEFAKTS
jgi:tetratricopeptide (TPR) repeat protein